MSRRTSSTVRTFRSTSPLPGNSPTKLPHRSNSHAPIRHRTVRRQRGLHPRHGGKRRRTRGGLRISGRAARGHHPAFDGGADRTEEQPNSAKGTNSVIRPTVVPSRAIMASAAAYGFSPMGGFSITAGRSWDNVLRHRTTLPVISGGQFKGEAAPLRGIALPGTGPRGQPFICTFARFDLSGSGEELV